MLRAITTLLLFQLVGEIIARALDIPIPGPVVGMLLLLLTLLVRGNALPELETTARRLLSQLALLFVPAGVGVMAHVALLQREWLAIVITLVLSTYITLIVTALTMRLLRSRTSGPTAAE
jgi:holin-like protein